nr:ulp1 protease family, C-terminal catalytic domain-containing protein [Tanacetum cinerariifolium]
MEEAENNQNETPIQNVNKSSAEYTKDNSNDEDIEDNHSAEEEQNTEDSESKTPPVKKRGREYKVDDDDDNDGTKKMKKKSKISDKNNKNSKIRTRTTPTALFNAMTILNGDRKKCLHEMGFGSMIGIGIHELSGKLGFYVIDNLDT